jgi:hypothetical protein
MFWTNIACTRRHFVAMWLTKLARLLLRAANIVSVRTGRWLRKATTRMMLEIVHEVVRDLWVIIETTWSRLVVCHWKYISFVDGLNIKLGVLWTYVNESVLRCVPVCLMSEIPERILTVFEAFVNFIGWISSIACWMQPPLFAKKDYTRVEYKVLATLL